MAAGVGLLWACHPEHVIILASTLQDLSPRAHVFRASPEAAERAFPVNPDRWDNYIAMQYQNRTTCRTGTMSIAG